MNFMNMGWWWNFQHGWERKECEIERDMRNVEKSSAHRIFFSVSPGMVRLEYFFCTINSLFVGKICIFPLFIRLISLGMMIHIQHNITKHNVRVTYTRYTQWKKDTLNLTSGIIFICFMESGLSSQPTNSWTVDTCGC